MDTIPSTPDPQWVTLVAGVIRAGMQVASGIGFTVGVYDNSKITMIATGIVMLGTAAWSVWQKYQAAKVNHLNSVASANKGTPVVVLKA